jgi:hypothetical protein
MNPRTISPVAGAIVGAGSAAPFALLVLVVFLSSFPPFAWAMASACVFSGAVTGATVGRSVATRPTGRRVAGAAGLAVLIGTPVGALVQTQLAATGNFIGSAIAGLMLYGLPAYLVLALPAFALGMAIARRVAAAGA